MFYTKKLFLLQHFSWKFLKVCFGKISLSCKKLTLINYVNKKEIWCINFWILLIVFYQSFHFQSFCVNQIMNAVSAFWFSNVFSRLLLVITLYGLAKLYFSFFSRFMNFYQLMIPDAKDSYLCQSGCVYSSSCEKFRLDVLQKFWLEFDKLTVESFMYIR